MPGTTNPYGFPYPVGTDDLRDGDNAVQLLAEALATHLTPSYLQVQGHDDISLPASGVFGVNWPAADAASPDWTQGAAYQWIYNGRPRWFSVTASLLFSAFGADAAGGAAYLQHNGATIDAAVDNLVARGITNMDRSFTLSLHASVALNPGDSLQIIGNAFGDVAVTLDDRYLRAVSV